MTRAVFWLEPESMLGREMAHRNATSGGRRPLQGLQHLVVLLHASVVGRLSVIPSRRGVHPNGGGAGVGLAR